MLTQGTRVHGTGSSGAADAGAGAPSAGFCFSSSSVLLQNDAVSVGLADFGVGGGVAPALLRLVRAVRRLFAASPFSANACLHA